MTTIDELRALAREIREERQIGGNTGERVGNTFEKVADLLDSTGGDISDIREAVEQLLQDVGFIPRDVSRTATDAVFTNSEGELLFWLRAATDTLAGLITAANNNKLIALPTAEELAQALAAKQNRLTFDPRPIEGSTNPVTSDGINTAIANFVTRSVSDLIYYYTKSETYTKEEVNALVAAIKQFVPVVAQTLPTPSADTMYKLYLIPAEDPQEGNIKDEYITIDNGASVNPRYTWEKIGSVDIDISGKADIGTVPADVTRTQTDATFVNNNHEPLFYLHQATSSLAGLMTSAEHNKLGALPTAQTLNTKLEGTIYDVSVLHPISGVGGGNTYASLSAALAVIPQDKRKGGMTVRYVYSYDNMYVQYRLIADEFSTDVEDWEHAASVEDLENGTVIPARAGNLGYGICTTGTYDAAKTVNIQHFMLLANGTINVLFTTPINTENATLNVSMTGAKPIRILGQNLQAGVIKAETYVTMAYDGTAWNIVNSFCPDASFDPAALVVDMGLPSGVKWASRDIDLTKPGGFCETPYIYEKSFFSWGNIDGHNPSSVSAFAYNWGDVNQAEPWYEEQPYGSTPGNTLTGNIAVGEDFDAARANLGAPWRMPTNAEFAELFANIRYINADGTEVDTTKTDKRVNVNGVMGLYLESKINGARLFFSCSGYGNGRSWYGRGSYGGYWSSHWGSARYARALGFSSGGVYPQGSGYGRCSGFALRPVQ